MSEKRLRMPIPNLNEMNKAFRQNIFVITLLSTLFGVWYYAVFMYQRRKALQEVIQLPRYKTHVTVPFVGLGLIVVVNLLMAVFISTQEILPNYKLALSDLEAYGQLVDGIVAKYGTMFEFIVHVAYMIALLCFIMVAVDIFVLLLEKLKKLNIQFPKVIQYAPYIFTGVAFLYVFAETLLYNRSDQGAGAILLITHVLFISSVILFHVYMMNVYILFRTLLTQKGDKI